MQAHLDILLSLVSLTFFTSSLHAFLELFLFHFGLVEIWPYVCICTGVVSHIPCPAGSNNQQPSDLARFIAHPVPLILH